MQFPRRDNMTPEEVAANEAAVRYLTRGKFYRFYPPAEGSAIPTGGPTVCPLQDCTFDRGWYIGFIEGNHVFQGKPINDQREIAVPKGYEYAMDLEKIMDMLRDSYFCTLFIGGSEVVLDPDQSHQM